MAEDWALEIEVAELRRAVEIVLDHIEEANGARVSIPHDYFWSVPSPAIYQVETPPELTIGQYSESWDNLRDQREGRSENTISFAGVWVGQIMQLIGNEAKY